MLDLSLSIVLSALAYLCSRWVGRTHPAKASTLTAGMTLLLLLFPLFLLLPQWSIELHWIQHSTTQYSTTPPSLVQTIPPILWAIGCFIFTARYLLQLITLHQWCSQAQSITQTNLLATFQQVVSEQNITHPPILKLSTHASSPIITGIWHTHILLPSAAQNWDQSTVKMVLLHELRHLKRKDLWLLHASQWVCILYWFNPLVWLLKKQLHHQCEFAVDAEVIDNGTDTQSYIHALCNVAESVLTVPSLPSSALAMANQASLQNRVDHLLRKQPTRRNYLVTTLLGISCTSTLAFATLNPVFSIIPNQHTEASSPYRAVEFLTYYRESMKVCNVLI